MQILLVGIYLIVASSVNCQLWNNPNGITVKTLYVPIPKGSSSIPIPDFSQIRPLATLNLPNLSPSGELQLASTLNQNFRPKFNIYQPNVQPTQDVRVKINQQSYKVMLPNNVHQIPNIQTVYQSSNLNQHQVNNAHLQQAAVQHLQGLQQFYQPEILTNLANPQNIVYLKNNSVIQQPSNGYNNGNSYAQNAQSNGVDSNRLTHLQSAVNYGHQAYTPENILSPRQPASNSVYTQYHSAPHTVQQFQHKNNLNQESLPVRNNEAKYSSQSSRYFQQFASDKSTTQLPYTTSSTENTVHSPNQQISYGIQNGLNAHQVDHSMRNSNPFQGFASQSNHQSQPVNTYAIVHQRVPANDIGSQGTLQSEQSYNSHSGQTHDESTPASYASNEQTDYMKTTHSQEQDMHHNQAAPQNQLSSQNSVESSQYQEKQLTPININSQQFQGHPVLSHVQVMMSQYRQNQQDSSDAHYMNHQQSTSGIRETQNQDMSSNQVQNAVSQSPYPDTVSETYYPDNKQVFVSPPPDYSSQSQQLPTPRELAYVRYSSPTETGGQNSHSLQSSQISQSNRNYGYQETPQYNNAYAQ